MREISLHLMDILENSIAAGADLIKVEINESKDENLLYIKIEDNGSGISEDMLSKVTDPFVTSRTTRKVGLGISLLKSACERCDGNFSISSKLGVGTVIEASFKYNHIDRAPIGRIEDTLTAALLRQGIDILYIHKVDNESFEFDSREIKNIVGEDLGNPEILMWLKDYVNENIENIGGGSW